MKRDERLKAVLNGTISPRYVSGEYRLYKLECYSCNALVERKKPANFNFCDECHEKFFVRTNGQELQGGDVTREIVRIRDNHTCQNCGVVWEGKNKRRFDIHHLGGDCGKKSHKYDRTKDISQLITYCHKCHLNLEENKIKMSTKTGNNKVYAPERYLKQREWQKLND